MSCGEIRFLDGGIIKNAQILTSTLIACALTGCTIDSSTITNLSSIDKASANKILDALCKADQSYIDAFANIILGMLSSVNQVPDTTTTTNLPTLMYGDSRKGIMGAPDKWIKLGDYLLPAYSVSDGETEENGINLSDL